MRVRIRLWQRLFVAFAALSLVALVTFGLLQQQDLRHGFLDYLNGLGTERAREGAVRLGHLYAEHGNWDFVRDRPGEFMRIVGLPPPPGLRGTYRPRVEGPHWQRRPPGDPPPVPPADRLPPPPEADAPLPPPLRPAGPLDLGSRLLLVDAGGAYVAGNRAVPIDAPALVVTSQGTVVGRLLLAPIPALRGDLDVSFARRQLHHAALIAGLVLLGALPLSWWLARWLLAPIRDLGEGTRALSAGRFDTRLESRRRDELGALAADFNRLAEALESNQDARRRWGADIAHELRTPIAILRGEIQALQDGVRKVGPDTLASLHGECDRLAALVDDLYQLALSDAGALAYRMDALDLGELLREVVLAQAGAMADAGLELALEPATPIHLPVQADAQRLRQLFGNLLANSRRYTQAPGRVRIAVRRLGPDALVEVEDTAPGVPAEALPRLFDRLYRVDASRSRQTGGAGLGLAICRNIVLAHGGQITAAASSLGGLCVSLRLPLAGGPA